MSEGTIYVESENMLLVEIDGSNVQPSSTIIACKPGFKLSANSY